MSELERAPWLRLARRQSQTLARQRESIEPPLRWESGEAAPRGVRRRGLSWAMALLPLLILGGATGTWAFVHHLRQRRSPEPVVVPQPTKAPAVKAPEPPPARRRLAAPATVQPEQPAPSKPKARTSRRRPPAARKVEQPPAAAPEQPQQVVIVPTRVTGEDQVIIVSPPAKMKPLWTLESYKKRGPRK